MSGKSAAEIAHEGLGYVSEYEVNRAIRERMQHEARSLSQEERTFLLDMEVARLDALQQALWSDAMSGDPKAVDSIGRLIGLRVKVQQLDLPDPGAATRTVLVVRGDENEYIEALKMVTGGPEENGTKARDEEPA